MNQVQVEGLPPNESVWEHNGRYVRVRFSETTDTLGPAERSLVRGFKFESVGCDDKGQLPNPEAPWGEPPQPGYYSENRTVFNDAVAQQKISIMSELNSQLLNNVERTANLLAAHDSFSWIPNSRSIAASEFEKAEALEASVDATADSELDGTNEK